MFCQVCGAHNEDELEYCRRCHQKLLVVSGEYTEEDQSAFESNPDEQFSFDEHLLERISILEEVVRRSSTTVRELLTTMHRLEQKILVNQTGITTLRDLLESKGVLAREEWSELWESRMEFKLLSLEKRERFTAAREAISSLFASEERELFESRLERAEMALLTFDVERAVEELELAHGMDPANYELSFFLAESFFNDNLPDRAHEMFMQALAVKPEHFQSLVYAGVLYHERGEAELSERLLQRAVEIYPDTFLPAFSLGAVFAGRGLFVEAIPLLEQAVAIEPLSQAHFLLGCCCYEGGEIGAAIRNLERVVDEDPSFVEAYQMLGLAYLERRWNRKALSALSKAQRCRPMSLGYRELVELISRNEEPSTEMKPMALEWLRRAEEAIEDGSHRLALSRYRQAVSLDPENPTLLVAYAMACLELDRTQEVEAVIDRAMSFKPVEWIRASAYATLMEALRSEGSCHEGNKIGHLMLSELTSPSSRSVAYFEMAINAAELGDDLDEALSFARSSLELASKGFEHLSLSALGWVHYRRREFSLAVDSLSRSRDLAESVRTLSHLAMALVAAGSFDKAREALVRARAMVASRAGVEDRVFEVLREKSRSTAGRSMYT